MQPVYKLSRFLLLLGQTFVLLSVDTAAEPSAIKSVPLTRVDRSQCNYSFGTSSINTTAPNSRDYHPSFHTIKAEGNNRHVVERILMDGFIGEMHLDAQKVATDSLRPLKINTHLENRNVSGSFFNFFNHKPTFKLNIGEQQSVTLSGGPLAAPYIMDQFHFHVYCTRKEAEESTLDRAQVPGELHLVFFHEKYKSYSNALFRYKDGLAVVAIYLEVGDEGNSNPDIASFASLVDYISQDEDRKLYTTAAIKRLTAPLQKQNARYDAYRGNLVEPFKCKNCVDVFVMEERFTVSVKQMTEFRKAPHCLRNDWGF